MPQSIGGKKLVFKVVLDAPDNDAIIGSMVAKELNEVLYDRPSGWFLYLEEEVKLRCPSADEVGRLVEARASRDVLIHGRGIVGKSYEGKSGTFARYRRGDLLEIIEPYHRQTWELIRTLVSDMADSAIARSS